jgi:hypothetical protein
MNLAFPVVNRHHDKWDLDEGDFVLQPLLQDQPQRDRGIDEKDGAARGVFPSFTLLCDDVVRALDLHPVPGRRDYRNLRGEVVAQLEIWSDDVHDLERIGREYSHGERLWLRRDVLLGYLQEHDKDLIVEVVHSRNKERSYSHEDRKFDLGKHVIYLLHGNGDFETLAGNRAIGSKIVSELGLDHTNKLLNRWMAHRVAELMDLAENAPSEEERKTARNECSDLILKLWEKRMEWPHAGPLKWVLPALRKLTREPPTSHGWGWNEPKLDGSWAGLLPRMKQLQAHESTICLFACFADIPKEATDNARQWLDEMVQELSEEERDTLQLLVDWSDSVHAEDFALDGEKISNFGSLPPEERTKHIQAALKRVANDRAELVQKATSRDQPLQTLDPNPMHGNISSREELHGEYFDRLYHQIYAAFGDEIGEVEEEEDDEVDFDASDEDNAD